APLGVCTKKTLHVVFGSAFFRTTSVVRLPPCPLITARPFPVPGRGGSPVWQAPSVLRTRGPTPSRRPPPVSGTEEAFSWTPPSVARGDALLTRASVT